MNRNQAFKDRLQLALDESRFETQKALADEMELREPTVSGWFNGAWPSEEKMRALVRVLDVSGHWLVTGDGPMRRGDDSDVYRLQVIGEIADGDISPEILQSIEYLRRLESLGESVSESLGTIRAGAKKEAGP